ncbi:MAG: hypothetical protein Q9216_000943 [Gyalolechia sp. 2 TL-2023]
MAERTMGMGVGRPETQNIPCSCLALPLTPFLTNLWGLLSNVVGPHPVLQDRCLFMQAFLSPAQTKWEGRRNRIGDLQPETTFLINKLEGIVYGAMEFSQGNNTDWAGRIDHINSILAESGALLLVRWTYNDRKVFFANIRLTTFD